ncbi:MAG: hypothetical protein M3126_07795 [Candidatus Eremiobacteraeota bacterium]|nr:hypothetical protein [Candidatus Eremiobacteraeota bacterium]
MLHPVRLLAVVMISIMAVLPSFADARTVVTSLGAEPLMGHILSASDLARQSRNSQVVLATAAQRLGLTHAEYVQIYESIQRHRMRRVIVPRHLDAMTWLRGTRVLMNDDLIIPANTLGWEIDLPRFGSIVKVFIPSSCGNLSLVVQPVVVAEAFTVHFTPATPKPLAFTLPRPDFSSPIAMPQSLSPVPTLTAMIPPVAHAAHNGWLLFLLPIAIGMIHGGNGGGGGGTVVPPVVPTPTPPFVCFESPIYHCDRKGP